MTGNSLLENESWLFGGIQKKIRITLTSTVQYSVARIRAKSSWTIKPYYSIPSIGQTWCLNNLISAYRLSCALDTELNEKTLECGNSSLSSQAFSQILGLSSWSALPADLSWNFGNFKKWFKITWNAKKFGVCNKKCPRQLENLQHEHLFSWLPSSSSCGQPGKQTDSCEHCLIPPALFWVNWEGWWGE